MASLYSSPSMPADENQKPSTNKTSAIRSFIHKRTLSKGAALPSKSNLILPDPTIKARPKSYHAAEHSSARPLGELQYNQQNQMPSSPKKSRDGGRPATGKPLHKKTLSTISLRTLGRDVDKALAEDDDGLKKPKKTKSSTNLSTFLSRPKSAKNLRKQAAADEEFTQANDKENTPPNEHSQAHARPPIYAQFSSEYFNKQPLGGKFLEDGVNFHSTTPSSLGIQRHHETGISATSAEGQHHSPTLHAYLPSQYSVKDISRQNSSVGKSLEEQRPQGLSEVADWNSPSKRHVYAPTTAGRQIEGFQNSEPDTGSFGSNTSATGILDLTDVDAALEDLLDRRNIPEDQRHKMRNVALSIKLSLIKHDQEETQNGSIPRPTTDGSTASTASDATQATPEVKKRPRSRTFTLSRSSKDMTSPTKKTKAEGTISRGFLPGKASDAGPTTSKTFTGAGANVASNIIAKARGQTADDFVSYLRKVQNPAVVEVGKMRKLRQLLRNEKIGWTDEFIHLGGMKEIVGLLHRIMEVEWREEHEDALLHETLLCLKALSTTTLAQSYLHTIQSTLFPSLIHLIFDEEKKGPAEFATRNIITYLLFQYLKFAPLAERTVRAKTILSYLRDPMPKEDDRPVPFVLDMRRERPYRVWCKEVVNVTKEVFWIFLHNLNVVSLPSITSSFEATPVEPHAFMLKHFPTEPPPVPAAPYVGSVEWDATNYLASHLDLMNGILACLPTKAERSTLRAEFRISGWERCLGGTLRLCKEKFYGGLHGSLRTWVAAGVEDDWDVSDVRCGPRTSSPKKVKGKKGEEVAAPKIEMPKLELGIAADKKCSVDSGWL